MSGPETDLSANLKNQLGEFLVTDFNEEQFFKTSMNHESRDYYLERDEIRKKIWTFIHPLFNH